MTFEAYEVSSESGQPIELYEFIVYGVTYRYTTAGFDYVHDAQTYIATPIVRSEIEETDELSKQDLTLTVARDMPITEFFRVAPPSDLILLSVFRIHRADDERVAVWSGRVLNCETEEIQARLTCENVFTSVRRNGLQRGYGRLCPYVLYDDPCNAPLATFQITVNITNVHGLIITAGAFAGYDDGRFKGGFIQWERTPGAIELRAIKGHVGDQIELTHPIIDLPQNATIKAAPGCKHNVADCTVFFDNFDNYGGFPDIPTKNPFGQNNVFL